MKLLIISECRLLSDSLQESLNSRGIDTQTPDIKQICLSELLLSFEEGCILVHLNQRVISELATENKAISQILEKQNIKLLILCNNSQEHNEFQTLNLSPNAILCYSAGLSDVLFALGEIKRGVIYCSQEFRSFQTQPQKIFTISSPTIHPAFLAKILTKREKEILKFVAESKTTQNIADKLYISTATVNNHKAKIMEKLKISGRNKLISLAIALKPWLAA